MNAATRSAPMKSPHLTRHAITVLMVDDHALAGEAVRRKLAGEGDIEFHFCQNPTKAMRMAEEVKPTVILQDLEMPELDGLTLVRRFRANEKTRDIPLIVLSVEEEPRVKAEAFALGANDYLVKLPDTIELIARIRYHSRGYIRLLQRNEALDRLHHELAEAADYVKSLLPAPITEGPVRADWRFVPSTSLGGDAFGYHWVDEDHFAIYLLDVCGHGVGAALLSISVINVLRSESLPDTDLREPGQVLRALNNAFPMDVHDRKYFSIWYGVYDSSSRRLSYASAGHPPALLVSGASNGGKRAIRLTTGNLVIGAIADLTFSCDACEVDCPCRLYVFCDGVFECKKKDGMRWRFPEFVEFMAMPSEEKRSDMDRLLDHVRELSGDEGLDDDFSIVEVLFE